MQQVCRPKACVRAVAVTPHTSKILNTTTTAATTTTTINSSSAPLRRKNVIAKSASFVNYEPIPNGPESWPVPEFVAKTIEAFPEKAIANHEETRVLLDAGYKWLDVRSKPEYEEERVVGSINIPIINATKKFNPETKDRELKQGKKNETFMAEVEKKFKDKEALILIGCSDGRNRAIQALQMLDEAGYKNIVGIKGGFNKYYDTFDAAGRRRVVDIMASVYTADGDAAGIHDSGAHFDRMDAPPIVIRKDTVEWVNYVE